MWNQRSAPTPAILFAVLCTLGLIVILLSSTVPAIAQDVKVKTMPIVYTPPSDGQQMYVTYCAPCHGVSAKGNGPAAPAFKNAPSDLTLLSKTHGGNYPSHMLRETLLFGRDVPAHGAVNMPVWGPAFRSLQGYGTNTSIYEMRIANLVNYIKTLQAK